MPVRTSGPLAGFYAPDYDGGSIVNLLSSIVRSRGGSSPHAELDGLPARDLADARCVLYVVLDGLGRTQLDRHLALGHGPRFFAQHDARTITTVFPATTAAAVTTFDTGASPAEHAILSWYLHLPDLGCVGTVLRTTTRVGTPLVPDDFDLRSYFDVPSHVATATDHRGLLSWGNIPFERFSVVGTPWEDRRRYVDLDGLVGTACAFAAEPGRRFAYVYWPRYDGLCHELGCEHPEVDAHFDALDQAMARLVEGLVGTDTIVCVLADHGLVDVPREHCIDLADIDGFMDCLATSPAGDQRQVSCFVRPHAVGTFLAIVERSLADVCVCVPGRALLEEGIFGPGSPHRALASRVGDYVLLCKPGHALHHTPRGLRPFTMLGSHGGMSPAEIQIPLHVVHCP